MESLFQKIHPELPVFAVPSSDITIFYTPGYFTIENSNQAEAFIKYFLSRNRESGSEFERKSVWLENKAREVCNAWECFKQEQYAPECLSVYFSYHCNLSCAYCFASSSCDKDQISGVKDYKSGEEMLKKAAGIVAAHCAARMKPFSLAFQGAGEPSLFWRQIVNIFNLVSTIAGEYNIGLESYITTNGVLSEDKINWLSTHFSLIGLSCDGPPYFQDKQRPLSGLRKTSHRIEKTARTIKKAGGNFEVRTTITPDSVTDQEEIVKYIIENLGTSKIRFEPVYRNLHNGFRPEHAGIFAEHFIKARNTASAAGCELAISGIRLDELHGPYCDVLRNTLRITPEGKIINCMFLGNWNNPDSQPYTIGNFEGVTKEFIFDHPYIRSLQHDSLTLPGKCKSCINLYHCTRGCPDHCYNHLVSDRNGQSSLKRWNDAAEFRCQVFQKLAVNRIVDMAHSSRNKNAKNTTSDAFSDGRGKICSILHDKSLPVELDKDYIKKQYESLTGRYRLNERRLPQPVWSEYGFETDGNQAETLLKGFMQKENSKPLSIYVHVPFCDRRCGFCDCYSFPLNRTNTGKEEQFVSCILKEIETRSYGNLKSRPVTTIHFGGGTPNSIDFLNFSRIVEKCKDCFNIDNSTEMAIETTSSRLSDNHLHQLKESGFRRLHVGVQTLQDNIRKLIGRHENAEQVIQKLIMALQGGFITSVDLIYGLPGQTLKDITDDICRLTGIGIHGISLYHLNMSARNYSFLKHKLKYQPDVYMDYVLFQAADQYLIRAGYKKNHFAHYAVQEDRNLYYTYNLRNEDLLALGPAADGISGSFCYRNYELKQYIDNISGGITGIEGGTFLPAPENMIRPVLNSLMCGTIDGATIREYRLETLINHWIAHELLIKDETEDGYFLSANGSWVISEILGELREFAGGS